MRRSERRPGRPRRPTTPRTARPPKLDFVSIRKVTLVEVHSTYYGLLWERNSGLWVDLKTAGPFNITAFWLFTTHQTPQRALPAEMRDKLPPELAGKRPVVIHIRQGREGGYEVDGEEGSLT